MRTHTLHSHPQALEMEIYAAKQLLMRALQNTITIPDGICSNIWFNPALDERDTQSM